MRKLYNQETAITLLFLAAVIFTGATRTFAQDYSEWSTAEPVASVNTPTNLEGCPFIAKDNLTLFFASNRTGTYGGADIYVATRESEDDPWGPAVNLGPAINTAGAEVCPTLTISGRYLYFVRNAPTGTPGHCGGDDIYVARLKNKKDLTSWEPAVNLGCQFNSSANDITPTLFEDEDGTVYLYFSSNRPGLPGNNDMDIYVSEQLPNGTFGTPVPVTKLNTTSNDQRPNIRYRDGLEIFFESDRPGGFGSTDLYSSVRVDTDSAWSDPDNLGPVINNALAQGRPSLSFDGTELYFMQGTPGQSSSNDIYVTRRHKLTGSDH